MESFLRKIWEGKYDDSVHSQFIRFSKGVFENRAVFKARKSEKIKFNSTFEMANDIVEFVSEIGGGKVSGVVLSKQDISGLMSKNGINGNSETKKGGLFYENNIDEQEMSQNALKELIRSCYVCLLDIEGNDFNLKMKKKLPKPNPKGADAKVNDKFCVLELDGKYWPKIKEEFLFSLPEGKKYEISHSYNITDIILPAGEKDPGQMRLKAKRKGKIKRKAIVDGKEMILEKDFAA